MKRTVFIGAIVGTMFLAACTSEGETPGDGTLDPSAPDTTSAPATTSAPDNSTDAGDTEDSDLKWGVVIFLVLLFVGIVWAAGRSGAKKGAADQAQAQQAAAYQAQQAQQAPPATPEAGTEDPPAPAPPA
jgi:hypothetical protein